MIYLLNLPLMPDRCRRPKLDGVSVGISVLPHPYRSVIKAQNDTVPTTSTFGSLLQTSALATFHLWTVVGKWTPAPTNHARYLNRRGRGARYDGSYDGAPYPGSGATFGPGYKTLTVARKAGTDNETSDVTTFYSEFLHCIRSPPRRIATRN